MGNDPVGAHRCVRPENVPAERVLGWPVTEAGAGIMGGHMGPPLQTNARQALSALFKGSVGFLEHVERFFQGHVFGVEKHGAVVDGGGGNAFQHVHGHIRVPKP